MKTREFAEALHEVVTGEVTFESENEDVVNPINLGVLSPTTHRNVDDSPKHMRNKKGFEENEENSFPARVPKSS
jgi:hypothetical protein